MICLRTKSNVSAISANDELDDDSPNIIDSLDLYLRLKGEVKDKTFI